MRCAFHIVSVFVLLLVHSVVQAHFTLLTPASNGEQDSLGNPQKSAPCGQSDPGPRWIATGAVTHVQAGTILTITIREGIFHPGHYRIAIAQDFASLPADPPVTADAVSACGATVIENNPTLPILADGLLVHTQAFSGAETMEVQLPQGFTCTNCTLQVLEFMSNHGLNDPGGCFYHHCATLTVTSEPPSNDAAVDAPIADTSVRDARASDDGAAPSRSSTCAVHFSQSRVSAWVFVLVCTYVLRRVVRASVR